MIAVPQSIRPRLRLPMRNRPRLPLAVNPSLRLARVGAPLKCFDNANAFSLESFIQLEKFRPHVLIGSSAELLELARLTRTGEIDLASVDCALFAVTRAGEQILADVSRVVLWQAFGVPIYEMLGLADGTVVASECQAQEGWHIEENAGVSNPSGELLARGRKPVRTGFYGDLITEACPCGRPGMRIANVATRNLQPASLAAIA